VVFTGVAQEPIGVGLGSASALEVGLTLQHTYGMPMLPGRALKGLCRRAVATLGREQALPEGTVETLFGTTSSASYGVLWDAWYDPSEDAVGPFKRDVVTVHHRDYYGKKEGRPWPSDFDDPIPVPFLVVRPGSRFLFVVQMPDGKWLDFVKCALQWGLENLGIGGKTNAGYGRLGEWSELPRPPQIETWTDCELRLNNVKGVISVAITGGPEPLVIQQNRWQPIAQTWPPEWRETFKKKRVAHASLKIERDGSKLTLLDVLPDTIRF
jgi:CRISPR-associated protein Cmr6